MHYEPQRLNGVDLRGQGRVTAAATPVSVQ